MRVLVVDHDSALLEALVRALRDHFVIDAVTNKADCLDLLRQNEFDLIVACERLNDGSGLELLGQIGKRWPALLRVFSAEEARLRLLRGRLGPFCLFQTLVYPIDPDDMLSTLAIAQTAHAANVDTGKIESVELSSEVEEVDESALAEAQVAAGGARGSSAVALPEGPRERHPALRRRAASSSHSSSHAGAGTSGGQSRSRRPTRFPQMSEATAPGAPSGQSARDSLAEASAIARAARQRLLPVVAAAGPNRTVMLTVVGAAAVLGIVLLGHKLLNRSRAVAQAPAATAPSHFSAEATTLVADAESAFQHDDVARARDLVTKLHVLAPNHPRLPFLETLLARRGEHANPSASASIAPHTETSSRHAARTSRRGHSNATPEEMAPATDAPKHTRETTREMIDSGGMLEADSPVAPTTEAEGRGETPKPDAANPAVSSPPSTADAATPLTNPKSAAPPAISTNIAGLPPGVTLSAEPPAVKKEATLLRRVEPSYPRAASRDHLEGSVEIAFTVSKDGTVKDASVIKAEPAGVFDEAALAAVRRWRYDPEFLDGVPVDAHKQTRLDFKLDTR